MACIENICTNCKCQWGQFSNELIKICPKCGAKVSNFFDEQNNESPRGDDYEQLDRIC